MRFTKVLFATLCLVAAGCGDDSGTGSGGTSGAGGSGGSGGMSVDAPMVDAPGGGGMGGMGGTGGMGGMRPDASLNDAGANSTPVTPNQVGCPGASGGSCTTPTNVCCATIADAAVAVMCEASASCSMMAPVNLACDGPEDCTGNQVCCGTRSGGGLGFRSTCTNGNMCGGGGGGARPLCHNHTQCPTAGDSCCTVSIGGTQAFTGRCYAPGSEPGGSACDTP